MITTIASSPRVLTAATLCPYRGLDLFQSPEALMINGKNMSLEAIELEGGVGLQWRLWKWASYSASEQIATQGGGKYETAVYASQCSNIKRIFPICTDWEPGGTDRSKGYEEMIERSAEKGYETNEQMSGSDNWPLQVLLQQPRHLHALLKKLHSSDNVVESVARACNELQRQIETNLMLGDITGVLELIWSWISPSELD